MIICMRTTYFNKDNEEIVNPIKIFFRYVCSAVFVIDLLSALPIDWITYIFEIDRIFSPGYLRLLKFVKLVRFLRLGKLLKRMSTNNFIIAFRIFKLIFAYFLYLHWTGLLWIAFQTTYYEDINDFRFHKIWLPDHIKKIIFNWDNFDI